MHRGPTLCLLIALPFATLVAAAPRPRATWVSVSPVPGFVPPTYDFIDLGTLGGGASWARDVDAAARVVGRAETSGAEGCGGTGANHAFLWADGRMTDLGTLGGENSDANAINPAGQIVGWAETASGEQHAALWDHGHVTDLGTLGGANSWATAINAEGQVVGWSETDRLAENQFELPDRRAFLWEDGRLTDLAPMRYAAAIDDAGRIVGELPGWKPVLREDGHLVDLSPLVSANGFDAAGRVIGVAEMADGHDHTAIWDDGVMTDLGALPDRPDSYATDSNAAGQIVGDTVVDRQCGYSTEAALWDHGTLVVLGSRIADGPRDPGDLVDAAAINGAGQIAATLLVRYGPHAVLLTPRERTASPP
jgi:probable HAF family extracellular repeat protein